MTKLLKEALLAVEKLEEKEQDGIITATKEISLLSSPLLIAISLGAVFILLLFTAIIIAYFKTSKPQ